MENFEIKPIKNQTDYKESLKKLNEVWAAKPNTKEGDMLELLLLVIEKYEAEHYPMPQLDPIEAIKYKMEENNLTQKDLVKYFGTKSRVSEVLNRKKPLTLKMIKTLYQNFGIPASTLLAY
jgi:HTH-type transcriptional regulator / antitoxin HigA